MELATRRFLLRDFRAGDRPGFLAYQTDPRYRSLQGLDDADALGLLQTFETWASERPRRNYQLAILRRACGELLGCCGLRCAGWDQGHAELGVELAPNYWGRYGYAVEVAEALLAFGFRELDLQAIHGVTASGNTRVVRLASWFGAEASATGPSPAWMLARGWHQVEWRITRERWQQNAGARPWWRQPIPRRRAPSKLAGR